MARKLKVAVHFFSKEGKRKCGEQHLVLVCTLIYAELQVRRMCSKCGPQFSRKGEREKEKEEKSAPSGI